MTRFNGIQYILLSLMATTIFINSSIHAADKPRNKPSRGLQDLINTVYKEMKDINETDLITFIEKNVPDFYTVMNSRFKTEQEWAEETLLDLAEIYRDYREIKNENDKDDEGRQEAQRFLNLHRLEFSTWSLSHTIRRLKKDLEKKPSKKQGDIIAEKEASLKKILYEILESRLASQKRDLRHLEKEVAEIKKNIKQREKHRKRIVENHFLRITGEEEAVEW